MEKHYTSHLTLFHLTILSEPDKELVLKGYAYVFIFCSLSLCNEVMIVQEKLIDQI